MKKVIWIGSSKKDLLSLPDPVITTFGYGLYRAQLGEASRFAKVLKGFGNAQVIELKDNDATGTYRAVYTVEFQEYVFVLHVFQKKSKQGIKTPQRDIEIIKSRLQMARDLYNEGPE